MSTIVIKTNVAQLTDVLIRDLGFYVPSAGGSVSFDTDSSYGWTLKFQRSNNLRAYLVDNAYGAGSSTLILNNGLSDILQADAIDFLNALDDGETLTENSHRTLRHLIHFIDNGPAYGFASGAYKETLPSADPFPTTIRWKTASGGLKIVEKNISYNANRTPSTIQWIMYDTDGSTILETVTDAISYSGVFEISRTRTIA